AADPINKFTAKNPTVTHTLASIDAKAVSVKLGDIFSGTNVVTGNITVTIAGTTTKVTAADWANATVTVPGTTGDVTVTINDNNTCITATGKVTLKAPANVTKWTASNQTIQLTLNNAGQSQTLKFSELFTAVSGAYIKTPVVTVSGGGSYVNNAINVPGKAGTYTVTVTDNFYCNATTATITVKDPAKVTKWTAKTGLAYEIEAGASKTLTLGDIFTLNNNYKVGNVTYTVEELVANGSATAANWATTQVTFTEGGTYSVTITDDLFSDGTYTAEVKITEKVVEPVQKFTVKDDYYLVAHDVVDPGSSDVKTIKLGDIFAASGEGTINSANVTVTTSNKVRKIEATITKNASDWTQTTIALKYSGEITLTITDGADCVAASAVVATAPKWVGDVDAGDASDIAQAHYGTKTRTYITTKDIAAGGTATVTVENIPADGVYGIQWRNGYGVHGTPGTAKFTVNGYSDTSAVTSPDWSDAAGTDFLAYLKAGNNTFTVENIGSTPLALYGNINAMSLDKSGYDDEDFLPYLKDNGEGTGGGTVTPPDDTEWPVPEIAWNGQFSNHSMFNGYSVSASPAVSGTYAPGKVTQHTISSPGSPYGAGVYVLQLKIADGFTSPAKIRVTTSAGYYAEFTLTEDGWSSSCAQDQLIYLEDGNNTIYIENIGDNNFTLTDIDLGYFSAANSMYYMYNAAQKANGAIPTPN
ncbi:MAG: hypothetical protein J6D06_04435, partial [Clostridia bacterium]|nr:hypothetical protein [Clostridia bacterium]